MKRSKYILTLCCLIFSSEIIYACSTCYGDANSNAGKGMDMAIITSYLL